MKKTNAKLKRLAAILSLAVLLIPLASGCVSFGVQTEYSPQTEYSSQTDAVSTDMRETEKTSEETENNKVAAPDFTVLDENGNKVKLSDFKGQPVVLNFWATWCYYCKVEMPDFELARENYPGVKFLMVNATDGVRETVEKAKKYVSDKGFGFDIYFDTESQAQTAYGISGYPTTVLIDKDGYVVGMAPGMIDYETLVKGINMILEEEK